MASELNLVEKTFTPVEGITATNTKCYKIGFFKILFINVSNLTINADTNTQIGSISSDIKPTNSMRYVLTDENGGVTVSCNLFSNGNIWVKSADALSNATLRGVLVWM